MGKVTGEVRNQGGTQEKFPVYEHSGRYRLQFAPKNRRTLMTAISYATLNTARLSAAVLCIMISMPALTASSRPNVVLIMTDNQTASLIGAYGNREIDTPNIDRIAREGTLFERAFATTGVCSPSRAVLLTGLIPSASGVHNGLPASYDLQSYSAIAEFRNWPQTLGDAGYRTALIGKYHLGTHERPTLGFDHWITFRGGHTTSFTDVEIFDNGERYPLRQRAEHLTDFWSAQAVKFIREHDEDRPFFLWLSYNGPYILPPTVNEPPVSRFAQKYQRDPPSIPQHSVHPYLREWAKTAGVGDDPAVIGGSYPWAAIDALNNRRAMINVAAETTHVDHGIGQVMAALLEKGIDEDTLVIFLSDQGSAYGQLGLWGNSSWGETPPAYHANMHIPLIVRHVGVVPAGRRIDEMVNQYDIFPTVLDYLGMGDLEIAGSPGVSFAAALRGAEMRHSDAVFFEYITTRVIQTGRWKLTKRLFGGPDELYDLVEDPGEERNLVDVAELEPVVGRLAGRLDAFFDRYAKPEFNPWRGGTGKALLFYDKRRTDRFRKAFPDFREPFVETREPFRDDPQP